MSYIVNTMNYLKTYLSFCIFHVLLVQRCLAVSQQRIVDVTQLVDQLGDKNDTSRFRILETALVYSKHAVYKTDKSILQLWKVVEEINSVLKFASREGWNNENGTTLFLYFRHILQFPMAKINKTAFLTYQPPKGLPKLAIIADLGGFYPFEYGFPKTYITRLTHIHDPPITENIELLFKLREKFGVELGINCDPLMYKVLIIKISIFSKFAQNLNHIFTFSPAFQIPLRVPESYTLFSEHARSNWNELENIKLGTQNSASVYLGIVASEKTLGEENTNTYLSLLNTFAQVLTVQENISVILDARLITDTQINIAHHNQGVEINKGSHIIPTISPNLGLFDEFGKDEVNFLRRFHSLLYQVSKSFHAILISSRVQRYIMNTVMECLQNNNVMKICDQSLAPYSSSNVSLDVIVDFEDTFPTTQPTLEKNSIHPSIYQNGSRFRMQSTTVLLSARNFYSVTKNPPKQLEGLEIGYKINFGNLSKITNFTQIVNSDRRFGRYASQVNLVVWEFTISFGSSETLLDYNFYINNIHIPLVEVQKAYMNLHLKFPHRQILVHFKEAVENTTLCQSSTYCESCGAEKNKIFDGIITWAKLHNIKIILKPIFPQFPGQAAWFQPIDISSSELKSAFAQFPYYVPRNQPSYLELDENKCIPWVSHVPIKPISFQFDVAGISVNEPRLPLNATLQPQQLAVMLLFALHKFDHVEISLLWSPTEEFCPWPELLLEAFQSKIFQRNILTYNISGKIYLNVPLLPDQNSTFELHLECLRNVLKIWEMLKPSNISVAGVHVSGWDAGKPKYELNERFDEFSKIIHSVSVPLGLVVVGCPRFFKKHWNSDTCSSFVPENVTYILCTTVIPMSSNKDQTVMSNQLDQILYTNKLFTQACPSLSVFFSVHSMDNQLVTLGMTNGEKTGEFLSFVRDLNEFVGKYQIRIFMFSLFDTPNDVGWWRVTNTSDIANQYIYTEKESEFLKGQTWRPLPEEQDPVVEMQMSLTLVTLLVVSTIAAVIFLAFSITLIVVYWRRHNFLTEEEIQRFLKGDPSILRAGNLLTEEDVMRLEFDTTFEIDKNAFDFGDTFSLLGQGNFGRVYKGEMNGKPVAVKMPKPGCTKEAFLSFLGEIKLLCYVGIHTNIVTFVGCYTKEIKRGMVYIATELCENGCLLDYLKKLRPENANVDDGPSGVVKEPFNLRQLSEFSFQIASGLEYLTGKKIIHGDIAARNVLLDSDLTCKIGDFGLSRKLINQDIYKKQGSDSLPYRWLAYEGLTCREFSVASDVWSFGVTLWEIFSLGDIPYPDLNCTELIEKLSDGYRLSRPSRASETVFAKMMQCWNLEVKTRPTFAELKDSFTEIMGKDYISITTSEQK